MNAPLGKHDGPLPEEAQEKLVRWDKLSPAELAELAAHPTTQAPLRHLQAAERWLESLAPDPELGACPPAEDLFDYGQGPGFRALDDAKSRELETHIARCGDCRALVSTLRIAPPAPLDLAPEVQAPIHDFARARDLRASRTLPRRLAAPLIAASFLLFVFALWKFETAPQGAELLASLPNSYPAETLLRGGEVQLAFPRGLVLSRSADAEFAWASDITFEVQAQDSADSYRIEVFRHDGGAFEEGTSIGVLQTESTTTKAPLELLAKLTPGHYTWEAWSLRSGLERRLGARDFEIRTHEAAWKALTDARKQLGTLDARAVRYLHELGFRTDAFRLAATLPESPERDAYLEAGLR